MIEFTASFCQCNTWPADCSHCPTWAQINVLYTSVWVLTYYEAIVFVVCQLTCPVCNIWCEGHRREGHAVSPHDLLLVQRDIDKLQRAVAHVSLHKAHFCISLWNSMPCVEPFGGVYLLNVVYSNAKLHHLTKTNKENVQKITSKTGLNV